ncbi:MAG: uroporphyrinogen-III C-methyltransferase [Planctomycetes bacterium]|nr:uroporphyrinogen-III C-methyltransferase [Planctomycetota bacterium]
MSLPYLLNLQLENEPVVVVGGGKIATRKIAVLLESGAKVTVIAPAISAQIEEWAVVGEIRLLLRRWQPADADLPARLVFATTDMPELNAQVVREAKARGRLVNGVDAHSGRNFSTPAITRGDDATVAVSSHNGDPEVAKEIRDSIGGMDALVHSRRPQAGGSGGLRPSHTGEGARATVTLVGAGPGDPDLLTIGGRRAIEQAEVVVYDHLVSPQILALAPASAELISAEKLPYGKQVTQETINGILVREGSLGKRVVRLKGGDPFIFGRGSEEIEALHNAGVAFKVIPGVSALNGVTGAAGVALTSRGRNHGFAVVSAAPPTPDAEFGRWARAEGPVVIFMGVGRAGAISREMIAAGRPAGEPVTVIARGGSDDERVEETTLAALPALIVDVAAWTPALIVVGVHREAAFKLREVASSAGVLTA